MVVATSAETVLHLDAPRAVETIEAYIREVRTAAYPGGIMMGLSGGLDSALLSTLVVRALGKDLLHVCFLRERHNEADSLRKSRLVADWLGVELEVEDITDAICERGLYSPLVMRLIGLSRFLNRAVMHKVHHLMAGETPFMTTLRQKKFHRQPLRRFLHDRTSGKVERAFNGRQLYRREWIDRRAKEHGALPLGAGNRSEVLTGWFVQNGVDDFPFSPIAGLYKAQVRQLSRHLGIPAEIIDQAPSPDMMPGITDEVALGLDYDRIDLVLDAIERSRPNEELLAEGLTQRQIDLVAEMTRRSAWKRNPNHPAPPVDGGIHGGFRVT